MILSDRDIKAQIACGALGIESPNQDYLSQIHTASMDLRLGRFFKIYTTGKVKVLDPRAMKSIQGLTELIEVPDGEAFTVHSGKFVLGGTLEKITLPNHMVGRVEGRSSLGRLGIVVHSTAGFIDAGFSGTITLEITNFNHLPVVLYPGMRVCQIAFEFMSSAAEVPYGQKSSSKYQGQELPEESLVAEDPEFETPSGSP